MTGVGSRAWRVVRVVRLDELVTLEGRALTTAITPVGERRRRAA